MKSLLIVGFPRSLTTHVYDMAHKAIQGLHPADAAAGEILNHLNNQKCDFGLLAQDDADYTKAVELLDAHKESYVVKDVVQPHLMRRFLSDLYNVLFVRRDIDDAIACQILQGWDAPPKSFFADAIAYYSRFPTVEYDTIIHQAGPLFDAFESFGYAVERFDYLTPEFVQKREETFKKLAEFSRSR